MRHAKIVRATTKNWWSKDKAPVDGVAEYDLSDHHPCLWEAGPANNPLTGLQYNVQFLWKKVNDAPGKKNKKDIEKAADLIADWIIKQNRDVVCLQELFDADAARVIEKKLAEKNYVATTRLGGIAGSEDSGGVRTFIKCDEANQYNVHSAIIYDDLNGYIYHHKVDYLRRADALADKGIKHVTIKKGDQTYHVLNTHLQAFYEGSGHEHYIEVTQAQLVELREYIRQQRMLGTIKVNEIIIINGDFNIPFNADPGNTEEKKKREKWFQRAEFLLGEEGIIFQKMPDTASANNPRVSFDPDNNTYLKNNSREKKSKATLDLTIEFAVDNVNQQTNHAEFGVREFARQAQLRLSKLVQESAKPPSYTISKADQWRIQDLSNALDNVISFHHQPKKIELFNTYVRYLHDTLSTLKMPSEYQDSPKSHFTQLFQAADESGRAYLRAVKMEYDRLALSHGHGTKEKLEKFDAVLKKFAAECDKEFSSLSFEDLKKEITEAASTHRYHFNFFKPAFAQAQKNITFTYLHNLIDLKIRPDDQRDAHQYIQKLEKDFVWSRSKTQETVMRELERKIQGLENDTITSLTDLQNQAPLSMQDSASP